MLCRIGTQLELSAIPPTFARALQTTLTIPNPLYYRLVRMGKTRALYNVPKDFRYWHKLPNEGMVVGRGMYDRIQAYCAKWKIDIENVDTTIDAPLPAPMALFRKPRQYQEGDVEHIAQRRNGVLKLGTGYGKTYIALALIQKLQQQTLIIVPRTHLVQQFAEECKATLGWKPAIMQGNTIETGIITIASIQTLQRRRQWINENRDRFGCVIVDEAHGFITESRMAVIQSFRPKYLYGMSATPRRTDEQSKAIFFLFGDQLIDKSLPKTAPQVEMVPTNVKIPMDEYPTMIDTQVQNHDRNALIRDRVFDEYTKYRRILILTKRVAHAKLLEEELEGRGVPTLLIESSTSVKKRNALLKQLRENTVDIDVLLGTFSLLATGTDIPALDTLVFAGDLKSDVLQEQSAGRILRLFGDKQHPLIIDFVDNLNPILNHQAKARRKFYLDQHWL